MLPIKQIIIGAGLMMAAGLAQAGMISITGDHFTFSYDEALVSPLYKQALLSGSQDTVYFLPTAFTAVIGGAPATTQAGLQFKLSIDPGYIFTGLAFAENGNYFLSNGGFVGVSASLQAVNLDTSATWRLALDSGKTLDHVGATTSWELAGLLSDADPLLADGEHYSEYRLNKKITQIGAIRSPIVHHSEFNVLNLQDRKDTRDWYKHIHSGIIFPANGIGIACAIHGGADFDGDLICTINNPIMVKGKIDGIPIVYESKKAEKSIVDSRDDKTQVESQLNGYNSKVGFATNISSSIYCMLEECPTGSDEQDTLLNRLKIGRVIQGEIIDGVKGLKVPPSREHWTKYKKITPDMNAEEAFKWDFNTVYCATYAPLFSVFYTPIT